MANINRVEMPVSGSSCANLFWLPLLEEVGTKTILQELAGRLEPWYLIGQNSKALDDILGGLTPAFNSQFYVVYRKANMWEVMELYEAGGERVRGLVATWFPENLTINMVEGQRLERRADLRGTTLRAITLPWCDFVCLDEDFVEGSSKNEQLAWRGMVKDIWLHLAAALNFTFTLGLSSDRKWGAKNQVNKRLNHGSVKTDSHTVMLR